MLPSLTMSGVLPPFQPELDPTIPSGRSPYRVSPEELVEAFGKSPERRALLRHLFQYRRNLRELGLRKAFQWIDGSFLEDVETHQGRSPRDIDLVTFFVRPEQAMEDADWNDFWVQHVGILMPDDVPLDSYMVDMTIAPATIVSRTAYWFGLFSHQRETALWKGIVHLELEADDTAAMALIDMLEVFHDI